MSFDVFSITEDKITPTKESKKDDLLHDGIPHNHGDNPTKLQVIACNKCTIEKADASVYQRILDMQQKQFVDFVNPQTGLAERQELKRIIVSRGLFDDCIGTEIHWQNV